MKKYLMIVMAGMFLALPVKAADFQKGYEAYKRGDYKTALAELMPLAEAGHALAQFGLGAMYENGQGVPQDYADAAKWYRLAAEAGMAEAQYNIGLMYAKGEGVRQSDTTAVKWYRRAAEQGYARSQYTLGLMYGLGRGVTQDFIAAYVWFNIAAANGNAKAVEERDGMAKIMEPADISTVQAAAKKCLASNYTDCP